MKESTRPEAKVDRVSVAPRDQGGNRERSDVEWRVAGNRRVTAACDIRWVVMVVRSRRPAGRQVGGRVAVAWTGT